MGSNIFSTFSAFAMFICILALTGCAASGGGGDQAPAQGQYAELAVVTQLGSGMTEISNPSQVEMEVGQSLTLAAYMVPDDWPLFAAQKTTGRTWDWQAVSIKGKVPGNVSLATMLVLDAEGNKVAATDWRTLTANEQGTVQVTVSAPGTDGVARLCSITVTIKPATVPSVAPRLVLKKDPVILK